MASSIKEAIQKTRFAQLLVPQEQNEELWSIQYCPCGHSHLERRGDIVARSDAGARQVERIESGQRLDAPIRHSLECPECIQERERQDRLCRMYCDD